MFVSRAATEAEQKVGPLVTPGIYRNYGKFCCFFKS
jgi:hypothetical protein